MGPLREKRSKSPLNRIWITKKKARFRDWSKTMKVICLGGCWISMSTSYVLGVWDRPDSQGLQGFDLWPLLGWNFVDKSDFWICGICQFMATNHQESGDQPCDFRLRTSNLANRTVTARCGVFQLQIKRVSGIPKIASFYATELWKI